VLCCVVLCCVVLCCVVLCCVVLWLVSFHFISFRFISFHFISFRFTITVHTNQPRSAQKKETSYSTVTLIVATVLTYVARSDLFLRTDVYYIDTVGLLSSCGSCVTVLQTKNVNGNQSTQLAY
jgi:hypothetical protein